MILNYWCPTSIGNNILAVLDSFTLMIVHFTRVKNIDDDIAGRALCTRTVFSAARRTCRRETWDSGVARTRAATRLTGRHGSEWTWLRQAVSTAWRCWVELTARSQALAATTCPRQVLAASVCLYLLSFVCGIWDTSVLWQCWLVDRKGVQPVKS